VNEKGWRLNPEGDIIDNLGNKKFDKAQVQENDDLPDMLNYDGIPF